MQPVPLANDFSFSQSPQWQDRKAEEGREHESIAFNGSFCAQKSQTYNRCVKKALKICISAEFVKLLEKGVAKDRLPLKTDQARKVPKSHTEEGLSSARFSSKRKAHRSLVEENGPSATHLRPCKEMHANQKHPTENLVVENLKSDQRQGQHLDKLFDTRITRKHSRTKSFKKKAVKEGQSPRKEGHTESSKVTADSEYVLNSVCGGSACKSPLELKTNKKFVENLSSLNEYFGSCLSRGKTNSERKGNLSSRNAGLPIITSCGSAIRGVSSFQYYSLFQRKKLLPIQSERQFANEGSSRETNQDTGKHLLVHPVVLATLNSDGQSAPKRKKCRDLTLI